jgi:hypothetical protein
MAVLMAITFGLSVWAGSRQAYAGIQISHEATAGAPEFAILAPTLRSSRLVLHGRVRCTASVKSEVQAGQAVSVKVVLHNVSKRAVKFSRWVFDAAVVLKAADGTTYDSNGFYAGLPGIPPPLPTKIRRGARVLLSRIAIPVRWSGPLQLTPECLGKALPALSVRVGAPWPRPDQSAAADEVVAAAGHLLDQCRPQAPGVPVYGQINPPSGNAPPMNAECSLSIGWEGSFLVAQVLVLIPPGLPGVQIFQPYETLWPTGHWVGLASSPPYEAIAWEFVVTRYKAIPVAAATLSATNSSSQMAPFWGWDGSGWRLEGTGSCGGTGFAAGGRGPEIEFISACPASAP